MTHQQKRKAKATAMERGSRIQEQKNSCHYAVEVEPTGGLTDGEIRVVRHLIVGCKEVEVARSLGVSRHTVHAQIASAHRKLRVSGRAKLIATVIALDIIPVCEVRLMLFNHQTGD